MKLKHILFTFIAIFAIFTAVAQTKGDATYYGNKFQGRLTSSGERYHKDSLTCAHRTLPFGTLLKVHNLKNDKEVIVKVTDRGPFRKGGIVDLSYAAAKEIDMIQAGVVRVEITEIGDIEDLSSYVRLGEGYAQALPVPKYIDPATGEYFTMEEWEARIAAAKEAEAAQRYKILDDKLTAKGIFNNSSIQFPKK